MTNYLINILKSIIFVGFIMFLIWNRLIREHPTKEISASSSDLLNIILIIFLIIFLLLFILLSLNSNFNLNLVKKDSQLMRKINEALYTYFLSAPDLFLSKISDKYNLEPFVRNYISFIVVYVNYPKLLISISVFLPSIIVSTIFVYEILYWHQLHYFYNVLPLLFIPLLFRAFIYTIDQISLCNIDYITAHLIYIKKDQNTYELRLAPISPNIPKALSLEEMNVLFPWLCNSYKIHSVIKNFTDHLSYFKDLYKVYIDMYTSSCYLIGWCYYLFLLFTQ